jgi:septum site-determining protein MinD
MGETIIISSGKGGVGKTVSAVNLGEALTKLGKSVAIIDGSLTTPDISLHLGIPLHVRGLSHILKEGSNIESACFNHKSGMRIIPGNIHADLLDEIEGSKFKRLLRNLKKEHDYIIVDCPAGLGREPLSAIKNCDKMIIVVNPELTSVVNSSKTIQLAKHLKVKPIGVIINRIGRHRQELDESEITPLLHRTPIIGRVYEDRKIPISIKNSETLLNYYPRSSPSKEFKRMAEKITGKKRKSFFRRLFRMK